MLDICHFFRLIVVSESPSKPEKEQKKWSLFCLIKFFLGKKGRNSEKERKEEFEVEQCWMYFQTLIPKGFGVRMIPRTTSVAPLADK